MFLKSCHSKLSASIDSLCCLQLVLIAMQSIWMGLATDMTDKTRQEHYIVPASLAD